MIILEELIADEDIPRPIVEKLRDNGISIYYIEEEMKGSTDKEVLARAKEKEIPLLSFDNDFFDYNKHPGIFYITTRTNYDKVAEAVTDIVSRLDKSEVKDSVIQVNPNYY